MTECPCCGQALPAARNLILHDANKTVSLNGRTVHLTHPEYAVVAALARRWPLAMKARLLDEELSPLTRTPARRVIYYLRGKLRRIGVGIASIRGHGYRIMQGEA